MIEVRFHGRGGQGAVTSAEMLALAAIEEGKYAQGFPSFGPERRGAPVIAYSRVNDKPIRLRSRIYSPDIVVILDASLLKIIDPSQGLKKEGLLIINTHKPIEQIRREFGYQMRLAIVDADRIAREELGIPITNTTMLGALVKASGIVNLDSFISPLKSRFGRGMERNERALRRAFQETIVSA
jgi:pyruvate ferredoxin oxidoreductase gamma subunit